MERTCTKCDVTQEIDKFYYNKKQHKYLTICKTCVLVRQSEYYHNTRIKDPTFVEMRTERLRYQKEYNAQYKQQVFDYYSGVCTCCGEDQLVFLQIDHIHNDGNQHRKQLGRRNIYRWLVFNNYPEGFQILCANCNQAKRFGICPHKQVSLKVA